HLTATSTTEIYTLSLHDALPIFGNRGGTMRITASGWPKLRKRSRRLRVLNLRRANLEYRCPTLTVSWQKVARIIRIWLLIFARLDRKSTRLNSSHVSISYAVFCL